MCPMRTLLPLPAALLLLLGPACLPPALAQDSPEKLRDQVLQGAMLEQSRMRAAEALEKADPEMLGSTLLEMAEKRKDPGNVDFLTSYTLRTEVRHLRVLSVLAAFASSPERAAEIYAGRFGHEDERVAMRAVEAAGLIAPHLKERAALYEKIAEVARDGRVFAGIEAARALNRAMDQRLKRTIVDSACKAKDNHVRKHLVWAVMDLEGGEKPATRIFDSLKGRPGEEGRNAAECSEILLDKEARPFSWNPKALLDVAAWWKSGRPKDVKVDITIGDRVTKAKVQGWYDGMRKEVPAWEHFAASAFLRLSLRTTKDPEIFDLKKRNLQVDAAEIAQVETDWQGSYILARAAGIAMAATLGEPSAYHRGWEPSYVDLHCFMKATKRGGTKLETFVDEALAKKPWPQ